MNKVYLISYLFNMFAVLTFICMDFTLSGLIISILICLIGSILSIICANTKDKEKVEE